MRLEMIQILPEDHVSVHMRLIWNRFAGALLPPASSNTKSWKKSVMLLEQLGRSGNMEQPSAQWGHLFFSLFSSKMVSLIHWRLWMDKIQPKVTQSAYFAIFKSSTVKMFYLTQCFSLHFPLCLVWNSETSHLLWPCAEHERDCVWNTWSCEYNFPYLWPSPTFFFPSGVEGPQGWQSISGCAKFPSCTTFLSMELTYFIFHHCRVLTFFIRKLQTHCLLLKSHLVDRHLFVEGRLMAQSQTCCILYIQCYWLLAVTWFCLFLCWIQTSTSTTILRLSF